MKKEKTLKIILIVAAILVIMAAISIGLVLLLKKEPLELQVQHSIENVMDAVVAEDEEPDPLLKETESRNGYEVLECTESEMGATATIRVFAPDLYSIAKKIDENYEFDNDEDLMQAIIEAISKAEIIEQEITLEFEKTSDGYSPILTQEFFDAYYGGVLKLFDEAISKAKEEAGQ